MIELYSKGGCDGQVTGSEHYLKVNGETIQVDCGLFQGKNNNSDALNAAKAPEPGVKTVLLTHAHADHCAMLPYIVKQGYKGHIISTSATRDLSQLIMLDSAKIQAYESDVRRNVEGEQTPPLYTEQDCVETVNRFVTVPYNSRQCIDGVEMEYFDAGHILGSSMIELFIHDRRNSAYKENNGFFKRVLGKNVDDEVRILFTGDLGRKGKPIIRAPETKAIKAPDYIILESTYGNRLHQSIQTGLMEFAKLLNDGIARGGKIFIPAFAVERTQELIYFLHKMMDMKWIPKIPIYADSPMGIQATTIFQTHPDCYNQEIKEEFLNKHQNPFHFGSLKFVTDLKESRGLDRKSGPVIIISSDGMCDNGKSPMHLASIVGKPENTVILTGYMADGTNGRKLKDGAKEIVIEGKTKKVKASIQSIEGFSSHADYSEMLDWLKEVDTSRLKGIFIVHGEPDAQEGLKENLEEAGYKNVTIIRKGETYSL